MKSYDVQSHRMWWLWKGTNPDPKVVAYMNKTYPPDWTYADFAAQFRAELYGNYRSLFSGSLSIKITLL
jgi:hypothetical protein